MAPKERGSKELAGHDAKDQASNGCFSKSDLQNQKILYEVTFSVSEDVA